MYSSKKVMFENDELEKVKGGTVEEEVRRLEEKFMMSEPLEEIVPKPDEEPKMNRL